MINKVMKCEDFCSHAAKPMLEPPGSGERVVMAAAAAAAAAGTSQGEGPLVGQFCLSGSYSWRPAEKVPLALPVMYVIPAMKSLPLRDAVDAPPPTTGFTSSCGHSS